MCMPEVSAGGGNTYEGVWQEETTYAKTQNTAKDTSMTICCIDLDTYTINAVCYGAGYDRTVIYYDPTKPKYKNMLEYAINSDKTPYRGTNGEIGYKTGVRIKSDGSETTQNGADYCVTGFIPVEDWDYIYLKNMNYIVDTLEAQPNTRFATYKSDFKQIRNCTSSEIMNNAMFNGYLLDENGGTLETGDAVGKFRLVLEDETAYIRFSTKKIDDTSIVAVNEPIPDEEPVPDEELNEEEVEVTWITGKKLDSTTGAASTTAQYAYSSDIPFVNDTELVISCSDTTGFYTHWYYYTADGTFIGKTDWADGSVRVVPETVITEMEGADVVRLRCNTEDSDWTKFDRLTVKRRKISTV